MLFDYTCLFFILWFAYAVANFSKNTCQKVLQTDANMKYRLLFILIVLAQTGFAQTSKKHHSNLPFVGERGHKFGVNYETSTNFIRADIGIMKYNGFLNAMSDKPNDFSLMTNHNIFIASEINLNKQPIFGPKIGYEVNYVFACGRINLINYFDLKGNINLCLRPELGATVLGIYSISYGYNIHLNKAEKDLSGKHAITLSYNLLW